MARIAVRLLLSIPIAFLAWLWFVWPPPAWYRYAFPRQTSFMSMREAENRGGAGQGGENAEARATGYQPVPLDRIAPAMKSAVLIGEDHRFYDHHGLDFIELRKALGYPRDSFSFSSSRDRRDLRAALSRAYRNRGRVRGASTITQQLAKNLYLTSSRSPLRKLKEAVTAWRLEYWLGKERILELYLNVVELGPGIWGVEAASQKYFGRPASRLSTAEAAALAGSLPFPLQSNPDYRPARMRWRQSLILRRMRGQLAEVPRIPIDPPQVGGPEAPIVALPDTMDPDTIGGRDRDPKRER